MNDEQLFLANAYLDGELTDDERQIAEADPEVMTEVDHLRALQGELRDIAAPNAAARYSAITAAMAEFGGGVVADAESSVVPFRPRPAYAKYLGIAAAVVAVAGLGIIVSQAGRGGDNDASTADFVEPAVAESTTEARTESLDAAESDVASSEAELAADDADTGGDDGGDAASDVDSAVEEAGELADDDAAAEPAENAGATDGDSGSDAGAAAPPNAPRRTVGQEFDPEAPITDEHELGVYGAHLLNERDAHRLPPSPNTVCGVDDEVLDTATVLIDDTDIAAYISVIESEGLVFAREAEVCAVMMVGSVYAD